MILKYIGKYGNIVWENIKSKNLKVGNLKSNGNIAFNIKTSSEVE